MTTTVARKKKVSKDFVLLETFMLHKMSVFRQPFVMVDRIVNFQNGDKPKITAIKAVAANEPHFTGHFPEFPVMPGVLIAETFGQASEYMNVLLQFLEDYKEEKGEGIDDLHALKAELYTQNGIDRLKKVTENNMGFLASQDLKFKGVVSPGDTLEITSEMFMTDSAGFNHFNVEARVGKRVVCSGRMSNWRQTTRGFGMPDEFES